MSRVSLSDAVSAGPILTNDRPHPDERDLRFDRGSRCGPPVVEPFFADPTHALQGSVIRYAPHPRRSFRADGRVRCHVICERSLEGRDLLTGERKSALYLCPLHRSQSRI